MSFKINYGSAVGVFPTECAEQIKRASLCDMKVLWLLCAKGGKTCVSDICLFVGQNEAEVVSSLEYWKSAGVICEAGESYAITEKTEQADSVEQTVATADSKKEKKISRADELPRYTSDQLSVILEENNALSDFIGECQRIMGKMFSYHEVNILIGLVDYLNLDFDYIMILLTYCVSHGKKTLHYVEKTAFGLYDSGVTGVEALSEELQRRERAATLEGRVRSLFGIGGRALTSKEKKEISSWVNDLGYDFEIIQKAYEVTADATGGASIHYANSVLERWNRENLRTVEQIDGAHIQYTQEIEQKKKAKTARAGKIDENSVNSSFNTDEFFEAAIRRSLGGGEEQ